MKMKKEMNLQSFMFFLCFILSFFMAFSSNTFSGLWMSMEINMFSFITIMGKNEKKMMEKSMMMYFLIQSISSSMILMSLLISMKKSSLTNFILYFITLSILLKTGMFPFHFWMLQVVENMNWKSCFLIISMQKLIPILTMFFLNQEKFIILLLLINSMISSFLGLSMFSLRKICTVSSMNHFTFMTLMMFISKKTFKIYFFIYTLSNYIIMKFFSNMNMNFIFQLMKKKKNTKIMKMNMIIFFSMMGIPPFLGFMPKMMAVLKLVEMAFMFPTLVLLINNSMATYFYLRLSLSMMLINKNSMKTMKKLKEKKSAFFMFFFFSMVYTLWNFKLKKTTSLQN